MGPRSSVCSVAMAACAQWQPGTVLDEASLARALTEVQHAAWVQDVPNSAQHMLSLQRMLNYVCACSQRMLLKQLLVNQPTDMAS